MKNRLFLSKGFTDVPIIGIIRGLKSEEIKEILPVFISTGLNTVEITMNTSGVLELIRYATKEYGSQLNVGAGTVCNTEDLKSALNAGAGFIVSPIVNDEVISYCSGNGIPVFPGAYTPTEIYRAWEKGASMVKIYPADFLGPKYIKSVKAPLNQLRLLPTGGIDDNNFSEYVEMGADGLGIVSGMLKKDLITERRWEELRKHFEKFVKYFKEIK